MCGRYTLSKAEHLREKRKRASISMRFNVAPTQQVLAILNESPKQLPVARWGLLPFWAKDEKIGASMINARSETVATKPAFRLTTGAPFYFAGLWEIWNRRARKCARVQA